jgi:secreted Zn-dependent insulinase-like peptidase
MRGTDNQAGLQQIITQQHLRIDAHTSANKLLFTVSHIISDPLIIIADMLNTLCQFNATTESVASEIVTIADEFTAIKSDAIRAVQEVTRETCNPLHPFAKFPTGNAHTFAQHSVEELTLAVQSWLDTNLHSTNIAVHVICGRPLPPIDIAAFNSSFPRVEQAQPVPIAQTPGSVPQLFLAEQQGIELLISVATAQPRLILSFALDVSAIATQDVALLLFILNYPPLTAMPQQLIEHGLIKQYHVDSGLQVNQTLELNINIALTELGLAQYQRIIRLWLSFLDKQHSQPIPDIIIHQLDIAMAWRECFSDDVAIPWAQWFEQFLSSIEQQSKSDSDTGIRNLLAQCHLGQMRILLLAPESMLPECSEPVVCTKWYETHYQARPFSLLPTVIDPLFNDVSVDLFVLNRFIEQLPKLESQAFAQNDSPGQHLSSAYHDVYHEYINGTDKPIIEVFLALEYIRPDAPSIIAKRIWVSGIKDKLNILRYPFTMIGGDIKIYPNQTGLTLSVASPRPLLISLLTEVLDLIKEPLLLIGNFATLHKQHINNILQRRPVTGYQAAFSQLSETLCQQPTFYEYQQMEAIQALNLQQVATYHQGFFASCYAEALIYGNLSDGERAQINVLIKALSHIPKPALNNTIHSPKERVLVSQSNYHNACFVTLLLTKDKTLKATLLSMVLAEILAEPFFERFRQELQIGYDIGSGFITHQQHPGVSFYINYTHHSAMSIYQHQVVFFAEMRRALHQFAPHWPLVKQSLAHQLSPQHLGFSQQAQYLWMQMGRLGGIEHDAQLVSLLHDTEFDEFLKFSLALLDINGEHCIHSISSHVNDPSVHEIRREIRRKI